MSIRALSPPGAQLSTADRPRAEALPVDATRVPVDRVSFSPEGPWTHSSSPLGASAGEAAVVLTSWPVDPSSAVDLLPIISTRGANGPGSTRPTPGSARTDAADDGVATPPTVADRARSAVHARLVYSRTALSPDTAVSESSKGTGLDSPPDTPTPDVLPRQAAQRDGSTASDGKADSTGAAAEDGTAPPTSAATTPGRTGPLAKKNELTADQLVLVDELKTRDRQVRSHEAAHMAAGGSLTGAASYSYETGPDGRSYAVGGEVPIELSPGANPRETIDRARQIRAAALAPVDPSGQDLRVAAAAEALELRATLELAQSQRVSRGSAPSKHVHGSEPCAACAKAASTYKTAP